MTAPRPKHLVCPVCKAVDPPTTEDIDGRIVHAGCPEDGAHWDLFPAVRDARPPVTDADIARVDELVMEELRAMSPAQVDALEAMLEARWSGR